MESTFFSRKVLLEKIEEHDKTDNYKIKNRISVEFKPICDWPTFMILKLFEEFDNVRRLGLAAFFRFNKCSYSLARDIIVLYNNKALTEERRLQFAFLWYKQLEYLTDEKRSKYYYFDLKEQQEIFLNGNPRSKIKNLKIN